MFPSFPPGVPGKDWNDLHVQLGIDEVGRQLIDRVDDSGSEKAPPESKGADYPIIWANDVQPELDRPWLMYEIFKPESFAVTYGQSNSGKTFNVLDQDLCLGAGVDWFGRPTQKCLVVYIAGEGPHSVKNRIVAYRNNRLLDEEDIRFALLPTPVNFFAQPGDVLAIIDFMKGMEDRYGACCEKLTIDTFASVTPGCNENSSEDMGRIIHHTNLIRDQVGCMVHYIHHSGKDQMRGARGHSSLRAATDTEIEVRADNGLHVAKITKQRDGTIGDEFAYRLRAVELGQDREGLPVTTCVPEWDLAYESSSAKRQPSKQESAVLEIMREVIKETRELAPAGIRQVASNHISPGQFVCPVALLKKRCQERRVSESNKPDSQARAVRRALEGLQMKKIIQVFGDYAWLRN